jgi:hypothetical protein
MKRLAEILVNFDYVTVGSGEYFASKTSKLFGNSSHFTAIGIFTSSASFWRSWRCQKATVPSDPPVANTAW